MGCLGAVHPGVRAADDGALMHSPSLALAEPIRIVIDGKAVAWARTGGHGTVRYTTPHVRRYTSDVCILALQAMRRRGLSPIDGPCLMGVRVVVAIPKSWSKTKQRAHIYAHCTARPDLSNYVKLAEDACNKIVYRDDSLVVGYLPTWKRYGLNPRMEIEVEQL